MSNVIHSETRIILKFEDAEDGTEKAFVELDKSSGGYPCSATSVLTAHNFKTKEKALHYAKMCTEYPLKIQQEAIEITINVYI